MAFLSTQEYRQLRDGPVAGHLPKEIVGLVTGYLVAPGVEALADGLADKMMKVPTNTIHARLWPTATEYTRYSRDTLEDHLPREIIDLVAGYSANGHLPGKHVLCSLVNVSASRQTIIRAIEERGDGLWMADQIFIRISTSYEALWEFICGDDSIYGPALAHAFAHVSGPPYVVTSRALLGIRDLMRERVQKHRRGL